MKIVLTEQQYKKIINEEVKNRTLTFSIFENIEKEIFKNQPIDLTEIKKLDLLTEYKLFNISDYHLKLAFSEIKNKLNFMGEQYLRREKFYRLLNPIIYLNAYKEKRANDAIYVNANVGILGDNGKIKNMVVFLGKMDETNLEVAKEKCKTDTVFIEMAKRKVIEKIKNKIF